MKCVSEYYTYQSRWHELLIGFVGTCIEVPLLSFLAETHAKAIDYNHSFQQGLDFAKTKPTSADLEKFLYNCSNAMKNPATFFKAKGHSDGAKSYKAPSIILD